MVDALIRWSLSHRALVCVLALLLSAFGIRTVLSMPVDVFPDLTAPTVTVITDAGGMAPTEVENLITLPIETALNGAPSVRRIRSATSVGLSVVWVEFSWDTDIYRARQAVAERLGPIGERLPAEIRRPIIAPISSIMGEVMFLAVFSDRHGPVELRTITDDYLRHRLLAVPGVAQVTPIGGGKKEYQVHLDVERMRALAISFDDVNEALLHANQNVSAGFVESGGMELLVYGRGRVTDEESIRSTVVAVRDGVPVLVDDLGEVRVGAAPKRGEASANGTPAVVFGIQKQPDANTLELTKSLDAVLDEIELSLPAGVRIDRRVFRQADFIEVAVDNVAAALRDGALLVIIVILLFLANIRATVITLTAIPLSLVVSIFVLHLFDVTINTMTLGGMAIAIGALVDDAVIDVENVFRRLRENLGRSEEERRPSLLVVLNASLEIRKSIVFATLIIVLVFLPLFFLTGVEGRLLHPLGTAYVTALLASLLVSVTVTPVLCHLFLPQSRALRSGREPALVRGLKKVYGALLGPILGRSWIVVAPSVVLLVVALLFMRRAGLAFLPEFNEGALTIATVTMPGTSLSESDALGGVLEEILLEMPEVRSVARRTGRGEPDEHSFGVEASEIEVSLQPFTGEWRDKATLLADMREALSLLPGTSVTIGQPISHRIDHMLSGTRATVAVKIFGRDLSRLREIAREVEGAMEGVEGVVDLVVEQQADVPLLVVRFDRPALARFGIHIEDVAHIVEAVYSGHVVSEVLEGRWSYDLVLRIEGSDFRDPASLANLPIDTKDGSKIPLGAVAEIRRDIGPNTISREAVERKIVVSCNVAERDVASVVEDCQGRIDPILEEAPGYRVEYGGQFESAIAARRVLLILGSIVVVGIGFLLHLAFGSGRDALLVMLNLPLALIGGVAGVFATGGVLTVASLIGFITVFGIATRNGIMLVSHIRHLQEREGVTDFREAVFRGAIERLAPILMTALATALALVPLALGGDQPGNEIQTPMATVILWGLSSSMILNMLVVPALYFRFGQPSPPTQGGVA
jgi:CzcA family heavy metal efflux pump